MSILYMPQFQVLCIGFVIEVYSMRTTLSDSSDYYKIYPTCINIYNILFGYHLSVVFRKNISG